VEYLVSHFENKNIYLFYGVNDSDEFLYMELLEKLDEEQRMHLFLVALTAGTSTPSTLYDGYVSDQLRKEFLEKRPDEIDQFFYYLCGPKPMIEATKNVLEEFEVDSSMFFSDSF
jgi:NAD(P)H-flavin reductase